MSSIASRAQQKNATKYYKYSAIACIRLSFLPLQFVPSLDEARMSSGALMLSKCAATAMNVSILMSLYVRIPYVVPCVVFPYIQMAFPFMWNIQYIDTLQQTENRSQRDIVYKIRERHRVTSGPQLNRSRSVTTIICSTMSNAISHYDQLLASTSSSSSVNRFDAPCLVVLWT